MAGRWPIRVSGKREALELTTTNSSMATISKDDRLAKRVFDSMIRMTVDVALALHLAAAVGWLWISPKGFPIFSSPTVTNWLLPLLTIGVASLGLMAMHRGRREEAAITVLCFASAWAAGAIGCRLLFPVSCRVLWLLPMATALAGITLYVLMTLNARKRFVVALPTVLTGIATGALAVWWQVPPAPSTSPWHPDRKKTEARQSSEPLPTNLSLAAGVQFRPAIGRFEVERNGVHLSCDPLLTFDRISPDRCWSLFAPRPRVRRPTGLRSLEEAQIVSYDDRASVNLPTPSNNDELRLEAETPVPADTYSHLNSFCYLETVGHKRLSIVFSPCPEDAFDVVPADYPTGRPARFAYLDDSSKFHVCEARSGEKGPFRKLASGPLKRGDSLAIELRDEGRPIVTIIFDDWSCQLSTSMSPSAGWSVPVNAIEFQRMGDAATDSAGIWITLAATAVGRGFETVGHAAGTYRNRVTIRWHHAAASDAQPAR